MNVMNVMNVTTPEIFGIFGILVTSFNELVHHMFTDRGLFLVIAACSIWTLGWAIKGALPKFCDALDFWKESKRGNPRIICFAKTACRWGWQIFWARLGYVPVILLIGVGSAVTADYLVLVFLNLMGW